MPKLIDLTGLRFGQRTVLERSGSDKRGPLWSVECDCGRIDILDGGNIRNGHANRCRVCARRYAQPLATAASTKHGMTNTPTWISWHAMTTRCTCSTVKDYARYGGRGITVCKRWLGEHGFENFFTDMGLRPPNTTLDRKDVNGNYEPSNCRWATSKQQMKNRRPTGSIHNFSDEILLAEVKRRGLYY